MSSTDGAAPDSTARYDVVIVGGGIAGLSAAWRLRHRQVLLLEQGDRVGGRIKSERQGRYWVNLGAQVFPHEMSAAGQLARELGLDARPIPGSLRACAMNGKIFNPPRTELLPFVLPLSMRERLALCVTGSKLARDVGRVNRIQADGPQAEKAEAARRLRAVEFRNSQTYREYLGNLPAPVEALFRCTAHRSAAEPEEVSAGGAIMCLASVLGKKGAPATNARALVHGTEQLPRALAQRLGQRITLNADVTEVIDYGPEVIVRYTRGGHQHEVRAGHAIVATPAYVSRKVITELPPALDAALGEITYGAFVSMGVFTDESGPTRLDDIYAVTTPGLSFDFLFNHAQVLREKERESGGSLMVYRGGPRARELMNEDDDVIEKSYLADLIVLVPELSGHIKRTVVQRWPAGSVYSAPGRASVQPVLEQGLPGRIRLAGDYFHSLPSIEQAVISASAAAAAVEKELVAG